MNIQSNLEIINFSAYLPLDIDPIVGRKWVTNGEDNLVFKAIKDSFDDSPTNSSICHAYSNYIYGDGFYNSAEVDPVKAKTDIQKHLSKADARLICQDFKLFGGFAVQVIWNAAKNPADKKPILIKYFPIFKLGFNIDENMCINGYWYSYDWLNRGKYRPVLYPKYTGKYVGNDCELLIIQRPSSHTFYANPEWIAGLRYAQLEGALQDASISHIKNGFSNGTIINLNNGIPPTEELKEEYKRKIINQLTGSHNNNKTIISFNEDPAHAITVESLQVDQLNEQYKFFAEEAERKIIIAHSAPPILFAGSNEGRGLGNNADEIEMATAMLFRKQIYPYRETIIDGLQPIFNDIDMSIILDIKDFESFKGDKREDVVETNTNLKSA